MDPLLRLALCENPGPCPTLSSLPRPPGRTPTTSNSTPVRSVTPSPVRRAARAAARSPPPTTPAASPWCPGSRRSCECRPRPTAARAGRGGRAPRRRRRSTRTCRARTSIGYARCSTLGQELDSQLDALSKHGIPRDKIFSEKISTRVRVRPKFEEALRTAREVKAHAPHCRVIFMMYEMKRLERDAAELTALADHLAAHGLVLEMLAGPLPGIYDPTGPGKLPFAFFAAMAETERENIRESTLEGLDTAARKGKHGGRPPVITEDMLHTVLRRRANGESVEKIQPDLIIPTGKRKGQNHPSPASTGRWPSTPSGRRTRKPSNRPAPTSPPSLAARFLNLAQKSRP
ncbi:recombinase family protein [Streptomyces sp. NPDC021212]|uniref:recombinase family protein n=1 Tax=Streptomyces sp. NPDC021212 TaxID=3365118 RepID=UPI00379FE9E6